MNVSVGDFISGQHNDLLDRMRRRLDIYRQRHVEMASHFDGRHIEVAERVRQETAAYHKRWMDSKAKRTTSKSKSGQRGDGAALSSNGYAKLKRKSQIDEQPQAPKTSRSGDAHVEFVYSFDDDAAGSCAEGQLQRITGPQNGSCSNGNFTDPNNISSSTGREVGLNQHRNDDKLRFNSSVDESPDPITSGLAFDFPKKEPNDDSNDANTVDDAPDLINFDEELYEFLDGIGRDGDLPADILQVLNQSELDNMDFHNSPLNARDSVSGGSLEQTNSRMTPASASVHHMMPASGDFKSSTASGLPAPSQFPPTAAASQASASLEIGQVLVSDAGPAAETLKLMAARRNQDPAIPGQGFSQSRLRTPSQTYNYSLPHSATAEYITSVGESLVGNTERYSVVAMNSDPATPAAPLPSCVPDKHKQIGFGLMNSYGGDLGFTEGPGKQSQARIQGSIAPYSAIHCSATKGVVPGMYSGFPDHSLQAESLPQFPSLPGQKQTSMSNSSLFNPQQQSVAALQNHYLTQPTQNGCSKSDAFPSYGQTVVSSSGRHHSSASYLPMSSRMQTGGQVLVNKNLMKQTYLAKPCGPGYSDGVPDIKMEAGTTGCSQTSKRTFGDTSGGGVAVPQFRNNHGQCSYVGHGHIQQGAIMNLPNSSGLLRPNLPMYLRESHVRMPSTGDAVSQVIVPSPQNQSGSWMQTAMVHSSSDVREVGPAAQPLGSSSSSTRPYLGYRLMRQESVSAASLGPSEQMMRLPSRGWGYSHNRYLQPTNDINANISQTGLLCRGQDSNLNGSSAMVLHPGQQVALLSGGNSGHQPSAGPASSSSVGQFLSCCDSSGFFIPMNQTRIHDSIELSLIDDFINGK